MVVVCEAADVRDALRRLRTAPLLNDALTVVGHGLVRAGAPAEAFACHLPRVGRFRRRLPNGRWLRLEGGDRVANRVFWGGWDGHEPEASPIWFELAHEAAVVFDIGAFCGYYALLAAHANPGATVVAFEPLPVLRARLEANLNLNHGLRVRVEAAAVGRVSGSQPFWHRIDGLPTSSGLDRSFVGGKADELVADEVRVTSLDDAVAALGLSTVDLVKIDTETTEHDVLAGGAGVLARHRPTVLCEVLPAGHPGDIDRLARSLDYRAWVLTDRGPEARAAIEPDPRWRNWLLAPGERLPRRLAELG